MKVFKANNTKHSQRNFGEIYLEINHEKEISYFIISNVHFSAGEAHFRVCTLRLLFGKYETICQDI